MPRFPFTHLRPCFLFSVLLLATLAPVAFSDEAPQTDPYLLEVMTVTAQKQEAKVSEIPESITAFSGTEIETIGIKSTLDLSHQVPNLDFKSFNSRRHGMLFMRGIKSMPIGEPGTGFYVDGVNYSKSYMLDFPLFDVERIEVLRGPQGTLYGRNTIGGVINVITREPDNEKAFELTSNIGNFNLMEFKGAARFPLIQDKLFVGLAGLHMTRDGYMDNDTMASGQDGRHLDAKAGRFKLRLLPTDRLDLTLTLDGQRHDDGGYPSRRTPRNPLVQRGVVPLDRSRHYSHDFEGSQENDFMGGAFTAKYDCDIGEITAITGIRDYDSTEAIDIDFSPIDMIRKSIGIREKTLSQELRIASRDTGSPTKWLAGVYYFHIDTDDEWTNQFREGAAQSPRNPFRDTTVTGDRLIDTENTSSGAALFGQITRTVWDRVELTAGLRWEYEETSTDSFILDTPTGQARRQSGPAISESDDFSALLPKGAIAWHVTDDHMVYANIARAHRSGGFNGYAAPVGLASYDEEYSWIYEIGAKSFFLEDRLMINMAGFYTEIEDELLVIFGEAKLQPYVTNAGRSHRTGVELEAKYIPVKGLELSSAFGLLDAKYDSYFDPVAQVSYDGNHVICSPDYTYNFAAQYRRRAWSSWDLLARIDLIGVGTRYFDDGNRVEESPYELVNIRIGLEEDNWSCTLWARNLFDEDYVSFENTTIGIAEDGAPMTMGISVGYRF